MDTVQQRKNLEACRRFALEQNDLLFIHAQNTERAAANLLERPDLDAEMFDRYLNLKAKACQRYTEALEHMIVINRDFPEPEVS